MEILTQIIRNLRVNHEFLRQISRDSACDLASIARVSHLFYELAMPLLWEQVDLWPSHEWPVSLSTYPASASKRALSHIRTMCLSVYKEPNDLSITDFNELYTYMCGCFRVLVHATSVQYMRLFLGAYDPNNYPAECSQVIEAINHTALRILKHVEKMDLRELAFHPGRETVLIEDMMKIIERKVHKLDVDTVPLGNWVHRLQYHEIMTSIEFCYIQPRDEQTDAIFWTAISQLPNVTTLEVDSVPLSPTLDLCFPQILSLKLHLWWNILADEWAYSFDAVFKQMPSLESLELFSMGLPEFELAAEVLSISSVVCRNLMTVFLSPCLPKGLLSTLGRDCANLKKCNYGSSNVDDEDLRQLSRCQNLCSLSLKYAADITTGLTYLTKLPRLNSLDLHYSTGKYIDKQLLLDFARSCPDLKSIVISDWDTSSRRALEWRPFERTDVADLFAAGAELRSYIEPHYSKGSSYTPDGLDKYVIRIDKLREDIFQLKRLTKRLGATLVIS